MSQRATGSDEMISDLHSWFCVLKDAVQHHAPHAPSVVEGGLDPWLRFDSIKDQLSGISSPLQKFLLFGECLGVPEAKRLFGEKFLGAGVSAGFLELSDGSCRSAYVPFRLGNELILVERPQKTPSGKTVSPGVYFSSSTARCLEEVLRRRPHGDVLEMGCGTGLLSVAASQTAKSITVTDIDPVALAIGAGNLQLNGSSFRALTSDLFAEITGRFDFIIFNPPWRIVAKRLTYPNPAARVGEGRDGLDLVRKFLQKVGRHLKENGTAVFPVEFPGNSYKFDFENELDGFVETHGCSLHVAVETPISIGAQAAISARTTLDGNMRSAEAQILDHYRRLNIDALHPAMCVVSNDQRGELRIVTESVEFAS